MLQIERKSDLGQLPEEVQYAETGIEVAAAVAGKVFSGAIASIAGAIASVVAIVGAIVGVIFFIMGFFKYKPRPMWQGIVEVKAKKSNGRIVFGHTLQNTASRDLQDNVSKTTTAIDNHFKEVTKIINSQLLVTIPPENIDFVIKWLHPVYKIQFVAFDAYTDAEIKNMMRDMFSRIDAEIVSMTQDALSLSLIKSQGLADELVRRAEYKMPDLTYQVEGGWRKELEKLSIKLLQRREYTRQLRNMLQMLHVLQHTSGGQNCDDIFLGKWTAAMPRYRFPSYPNGNINWHIIRVYWGYEGQEGLQAIAENSWSKLAAIRSSLRSPLPSTGLTCYRNGLYGTYYRMEGNANIIFKPVRDGTKIKIVPVIDIPYWEITGTGRTGRCPGLPTGANMAYHRMLQKYLDIFTNYLFSEIPGEAAEYIAKNLSANQAYMDKFVIFISKIPYHYVRDALWLPNIAVSGYKYAPTGVPLYCQWPFNRPGDHLTPTDAIRTGTEQNVLRGDHCWTHQFITQCIKGDFSHLNNIPEKINALMQDTIDLYNIWMQGYGLEWKQRAKAQFFDTLLPNIRQMLRPELRELLSYAGVAVAVSPKLQLDVEVDYQIQQVDRLKKIEELNRQAALETKEDLESSLERLRLNKDDIISLYGAEEYKKLLGNIEAGLNNVTNMLADSRQLIIENQDLYIKEEFRALIQNIDTKLNEAKVKAITVEVEKSRVDIEVAESEKEKLEQEMAILEETGQEELVQFVKAEIEDVKSYITEEKEKVSTIQAGIMPVPWWLLIGGGLLLGLSYLKKRFG